MVVNLSWPRAEIFDPTGELPDPAVGRARSRIAAVVAARSRRASRAAARPTRTPSRSEPEHDTSTETSTTAGAAGARARPGGNLSPTAMPVVPASPGRHRPTASLAARLTWAETVPGGRYTTKVLARGTRLRLRDLDGNACAHLLLYRADAPWERLNVADTVKVPWQAYLADGHPLLTDQGRVLATIVADTSGATTRSAAPRRWAATPRNTVRAARNRPSPAGRELLHLAALKHGLERRDVPPSLSFFHGVRVEADGALSIDRLRRRGAPRSTCVHLPVIVPDRQHRAPARPGTGLRPRPRGARLDRRRRPRRRRRTIRTYQRAFSIPNDA